MLITVSSTVDSLTKRDTVILRRRLQPTPGAFDFNPGLVDTAHDSDHRDKCSYSSECGYL